MIPASFCMRRTCSLTIGTTSLGLGAFPVAFEAKLLCSLTVFLAGAFASLTRFSFTVSKTSLTSLTVSALSKVAITLTF